MGISLPPHSFPMRFYIAKMTKVLKWFKHDVGACRGVKMMQLKKIYKFWGVGAYFEVCEILCTKENYQFQVDESSLQILSDLISCDDETKFISFIRDSINIGLFVSDGEYFYSPALTKRGEQYNEVCDKNSKNGKLGALKRLEMQATAKRPLSEHQATAKLIEENRIEENILKKEFSDEVVKLGQYVFKDEFSVNRAITTYSTSLTNLKESFLNFLMSEKYHEKELDELAMSKMSKHFFRWLLTHQPEKVSKDYNALMEGKHGEDYYVSLTPVSEERIEEMIKEGWVQTPQGMVKRLKK